jgi:surfactin synthase thioesterase subunit
MTASFALAPLFDRPFAFVGYSMGALVAYELARVLSAAGHDGPAHLIVLSQRAPHLGALVPPLNRLPQHEFVRAVDARYGGIPAVVLNEPELLDRVVPTLRAELALFEEYSWVPSAPLACSITALAGTRDRTLSPSQVAAWSDTTAGIVDVTMLDSGHFILTDVTGSATRVVWQRLETGSTGAHRSGVS